MKTNNINISISFILYILDFKYFNVISNISYDNERSGIINTIIDHLLCISIFCNMWKMLKFLYWINFTALQLPKPWKIQFFKWKVDIMKNVWYQNHSQRSSINIDLLKTSDEIFCSVWRDISPYLTL